MDYESLLIQRVCDPLELNDTRITLSPDMKKRLATGHDQGLTPIENWDFGVLAGAGGLRSTANDLLSFLTAYFTPAESQLDQVIATAKEIIQRPTGREDMQVSLAWGILTSHGREISFHTGGTGGYNTTTPVPVTVS